MIRYVILTIVQLLFTLIAYALAPVVALFCKDDGYLPNWLAWFQTFDAPLDAGVRDKYAGFDPNDSKWWNRTKWLWRNPAYGFCYWPLGLPYDPNQWVIKTCERDAAGNLTNFYAVTKSGEHFCKTNSNGLKLGYKLWWALKSDNTLKPALESWQGPDNRLPICFTPRGLFK